MKFVPLFEIRLQHGFYPSGRCRDLAVEPTAAGQRRIKNHRLAAKPRPDGIAIFAPLDDHGQPFIPFPAGMTIGFQLQLQNPDFDLFTDLGFRAPKDALVYRNSSQAAGPLTAETSSNPRPQGVFATVEITDIAADWLGQNPVFTVPFEPKQARWVYYLVTERKNGSGDPRIVDNDPTRADAPLAFDTTALDDDSSDPVAQDLASQFPEARRYRLVSRDLIPCSQVGRHNLALLLGSDEITSALPNPSIRNFSTIDVTVDTNIQAQDSIYRIVKH